MRILFDLIKSNFMNLKEARFYYLALEIALEQSDIFFSLNLDQNEGDHSRPFGNSR